MKLLGNIPKKVYLACSGGKDSMMMLDFLLKGRRDIHVLYYNHNTEHGKEAEHFIHEFCRLNNISLDIGFYYGEDKTELAWRNARYKFLSNYTNRPIITCHHLNDNIETFLLSEIKGQAKFIPYQRNNVIRPLLLVSRNEIDSYATRHNIKWIEDPSNSQVDYSRNKIRNLVIPVLKEINPGLETTYYYKCLNKYEKDGVI